MNTGHNRLAGIFSRILPAQVPQHRAPKVSPQRHSSYMPQLDSLRALALIFVILTHWIPARRLPSGEWVNVVNLFGAGQMALQMFFIMSGFLITGILLSAREKYDLLGESKAIPLRRFYARRFLRIFPAYYLTLLVLYIYGDSSVVDPIRWHVSYTTNIFYALRGDWYGAASHLWSLSVEEQFYLVWPLVILFAPKRYLLPFFILCILIGPVFRYVAQAHLGFNFVQIAVNPLRSLDTLGLGAVFAYLQRQDIARTGSIAQTRRRAVVIGVSAIGVICGVVLLGSNIGSEFLQFNVLGAAYPFALLMLVYLAATRIKGWLGVVLGFEPLLFIGKISYALYIFHGFVPGLTTMVFQKFGVNPHAALGMWGFISFNFVVLLMAGSASWFLYEKPILNLKRLFPYVGAKPVAKLGNAASQKTNA